MWINAGVLVYKDSGKKHMKSEVFLDRLNIYLGISRRIYVWCINEIILKRQDLNPE